MSQSLMPSFQANQISLRLRLAAWLGLVLLASMIGLSVAARSHADAAANRSYDRMLLGSALSIAETISINGDEIRIDLPYAALDMLSAAPDDRVFYSVTGPSGEYITGNAELPMAEGFRPRDEPHFFDANFKGEKFRFATLGREIARSSKTGWIWVEVGQSRRARNALGRELFLNAILPIGAMMIIVLLFVWFAIGRALSPLRKIGQEIAGRQPNDLTPINSSVPQDVAPLIISLNVFMRRLDENIEALRSFIADAAHQMRTPLAALRAQAQMSDEDDQDELRKGLQAVERNAAKLTRLLDQLLSDSTVTHRSDIRDFSPFDLGRNLRQCLLEAAPMRSDATFSFKSSCEDATYTGDSVMIGEAVKNLIHNAVHHGDGESKGVDVTLEEYAGNYVISVSDHGKGVSDTQSEVLFERFARHNHQASGFGLGLAIVKRVVVSHHGKIKLFNRKGGGLTVEISLPKSAP